MDDIHRKALLAKARKQYWWTLVNFALAPVCGALAVFAIEHGYDVVGLLMLPVSVVLVMNAVSHNRCGMEAEEEAEQE